MFQTEARVVLLIAFFSGLCSAFLYESYDINSEDLDGVKFYLYTRNVTRQDHRARLSDIQAGSFDPKLKTFFTCHGWNGADPAGRTSQMKNIVRALLEKENCNVFNLDWGYFAKNTLEVAASHTKRVGRITAEFIKLLEQEFHVKREDMHAIGWSLGGQVVSHIGASLQSPKLGRISGLDSAEVGCTTNTTCLDPSDATYVDEIHTAISKLNKGHADYWPILGDKLPKGRHAMAPYIFAESIKAGSCAFEARKCYSERAYQQGVCETRVMNHMGFYSVKPKTRIPNTYRINLDLQNPCKKKTN